MRAPRKWQTGGEGEAGGRFFHCVSRVVNREFVFGDVEKDHLVRLMRKVEAFTGVRVLTYCMMDNHFHLLLDVPERPGEGLSDEAVLNRIRGYYRGPAGSITRRDVEWKLHHWREEGAHAAVEELKAQYFKRMYDLSEFMKSFKQRFTQWFNGRHEREGTLWESRFKSVLVGDDWQGLLAVAAYIDLNPVRAGIASDPKDYRWSGYGEAAAGRRTARQGLASILEGDGQSGHWTHVMAEYRQLLYGVGEKEKESRGALSGRVVKKRGLDGETVRRTLAAGGRLSPAQFLRCRVRYFTDGFVIGTREFVNGFFSRNRECFSARRKDGARRMRAGPWADLVSMRDLRIDVVTAPGAGRLRKGSV